MRLKLSICLLAAAVIATAALSAAHQRGFLHLLGIDTQASDNYDFISGIGPMLLTALGMTTLVSGMWHACNCHAPGCWRPGRHRVDGTPWCNRHHHQARRQAPATLSDVTARLDTVIGLLEPARRGGQQ